MKIHFIAIGGSAMHNLALALYKKGFTVTGSDDEIVEPSRSRLAACGLLPEAPGWFPAKITAGLDAIVLGMHARGDNPELVRARELGVKILSYPEFLYEQTRDKIRVVIGGSHGKTTITSMIMHVLRESGMAFDYMVGAQLDGFDTMVGLSNDSRIAVFEGDEYLSSPEDRRPKFHLYHPHIGVLSGIAWDHINVFPTFENYVEQFRRFAELIEPGGRLFYFNGDPLLREIAAAQRHITCTEYQAHPAEVRG
ncbi:MAG TPA: Mur ligase family protein, partial [Prolixibacteraceae bacterium]|nr:Mur ligase family protein [Prolixibacteraceae bacterium]